MYKSDEESRRVLKENPASDLESLASELHDERLSEAEN